MLPRPYYIVTLFLSVLIMAAMIMSNQVESRPHNAYKDYRLLVTKAPRLNHDALKKGLIAYHNAMRQGHDRQHVLTIIDYTQPSSNKRLYVFDVAEHKLLYNTAVAHGKGSGTLNARSFSNRSGSRKSSLGLYATANTYYGRDGYSLRLKGLEPGFNDHAYRRSVVVHGASYVESDFIKRVGRAGRSWGCPALPKHISTPIINKIKNDTLVFAYYPDRKWLSQSSYLHT